MIGAAVNTEVAHLHATERTTRDHALDVNCGAGHVSFALSLLTGTEGRVVGTGTHTDLMRSCEVYREIVLSQLTEEEAA